MAKFTDACVVNEKTHRGMAFCSIKNDSVGFQLGIFESGSNFFWEGKGSNGVLCVEDDTEIVHKNRKID